MRKVLKGTVPLTGSKSESNRALIIQALSKGKVKIEQLSQAADTVTLQRALNAIATTTEKTIDVGPAGTTMRFLTAYLSLQEGPFTLTGSERMKERPIGVLVDALKTLGAHIAYTEKIGYPPLRIIGPFHQVTDTIRVPGNISSQYLSALLLIAPYLPLGLTLIIEGELTSKPYLMMTLQMLQASGIDYTWQDNTIRIGLQILQPTTLVIEPDWSAASYWYALLALADEGELTLPGLRPDSLQGDQAIQTIMTAFGIASTFTAAGLNIRKKDAFQPLSVAPHWDFVSCPDLAQTVIVCCAALRQEATFTGLHTLRIKETDRIMALQNELAKFGVKLVEGATGVYRLDCQHWFAPDTLFIKTYEDHRMAMAFAPLALVFKQVEIEDPSVVEKSYPAFWQHLKQFDISFGAS